MVDKRDALYLSHGYISSYAKLVLLDIALYDVPVKEGQLILVLHSLDV